MIIGIPIYDGVDLLDVAAPYEIFNWMKAEVPALGVEVMLLAVDMKDVTTLNGLTMRPEGKFKKFASLDVLWVPGGDPRALNRLIDDPKRTYLDYLCTVSAGARYVTSVCEGALLLAAAGLLDGFEATTHWAFIPCLKKYPAIKVAEGHPRFVVDRTRVTGGGISSGLDEAFKLVELLSDYATAQKVQQTTQYYPCPPVSGTLPDATGCTLDDAKCLSPLGRHECDA
jgi:transcriptional regulator GlxA family with amidase domain